MPRLHSRLLPVLGLVAGGLVCVPTAGAATNSVTLKTVKADRATLSLSKATTRALKRDHVSFTTTRPATHKGASSYFPQKSGKWNFGNSSGTINYNGVSKLVLRKRSAKFTGLTFSRTVKGKKSSASLTGKYGKRKVTLFTFTGKTKVKVKGSTVTISGLNATVGATAAKDINKALKHKVFKSKQKLGSFTLVLSSTGISFAAGSGGSGAGATASPFVTSGVGVSFTPEFQDALTSAGLSATPIAPAADGLLGTLSGVSVPDTSGTSVTLPGVGGTSSGGSSSGSLSYDDGTLTGTVPLSGGLDLGNGLANVSLTSPVLTLGTGTDGSTLSFSLDGGPEVQVLQLNTSQLEAAATPSGQLSLTGLLATLSSEGASSLNQLLGGSYFTTAEPVGGLTLVVPSSSATTS